MALFKEVLTKVLEKEEIQIIFPNLKFSATKMVEIESFKALQKIKAIIEDDSLSDFECIKKLYVSLMKLVVTAVTGMILDDMSKIR